MEKPKEKVKAMYVNDDASLEELAAALHELSEALKTKKMF